MSQALFSTHTVSAEFKSRLSRAESAIAEMTEIDDAEKVAQKLYEEQRFGETVLRRHDAPVTHAATEDGIRVVIRIPVDGDLTPFRLRSSYGRMETPSPYRGATLQVVDTWSAPSPENSTHVRLSRTFTNPSREEVLAWGADLADRVEAALTIILQEVGVENDALKVAIESKVRDRKAMLEAGEGLGDLGVGI